MLESNSYKIYFSWTPREESAEKILERMERSNRALSPIIPAFGSFKVFDLVDALRQHGGGGARKRKQARLQEDVVPTALAPIEPTAPSGFMVASAPRLGFPEGLSLFAANAGRKTFPGMCGLTFGTRPEPTPDPQIVSYPVFKSAIRLLAPIWESTYAWTTTTGLDAKVKPGTRIFGPSWIAWLATSLAGDFAPSDAFAIEHEADGSVFLVATTEVFKIGNPAHVDAAIAIGAALEPVEKKLLRAGLG